MRWGEGHNQLAVGALLVALLAAFIWLPPLRLGIGPQALLCSVAAVVASWLARFDRQRQRLYVALKGVAIVAFGFFLWRVMSHSAGWLLLLPIAIFALGAFNLLIASLWSQKLTLVTGERHES